MIDKIIYNYWESEASEITERDIEVDLKTNLITDIIGPRRAGKTYLMLFAAKKAAKSTNKKAAIYINFENRRLLPLKESYFNQIIDFIYHEELIEKYGKVYLFLDEVQRIAGWEKFIRGIYDEFKSKIKITVSGSNANLLSEDYGTLLTGRHLTIRLFPLSFKEFLRFQGLKDFKAISDKKRVKITKMLDEYLEFGGFPEVVLEKNKTKKEELINQLFADISARDILSREDTRKSFLLEEFFYFLSANIGSLLSFNKMVKYFASRGIKTSVPTLGHYFKLAENAFLFFNNTIFSYKIKDQLQYPRKIYSIDTGLANLVGFKFSKNLGKLYENVVAVELLKRSLKNSAVKVYYWKGKNDREVDFVVKEKMKIKQLVQVCFDLSDTKTEEREIKSLLEGAGELKCNDLLIITKDFEGKKKRDGKLIKFIPLWKWLLE